MNKGFIHPAVAAIIGLAILGAVGFYTEKPEGIFGSGGVVSTGRAPADAQYVVVANNATLTADRALTGTSNQLTVTDGGANGNITLSIPADFRVSGITMGSSTAGFYTATSTTASSTFDDILFVQGQGTGLSLTNLTLSGSCTGCGGISGGTANMLAVFTSATAITASGTPQVTAIIATSTTATSSLPLLLVTQLQGTGGSFSNLTVSASSLFVNATTTNLAVSGTASTSALIVNGGKIPEQRLWGFALASSTASEDFPVPVTHPKAATISKVYAKSAMLDSVGTATTTGYLFNLPHGTNKGTRTNLFSAAVDTTIANKGTSTYTTFCASGCDITVTFNDATVAANEEWWLVTSGASSSLHTLTIQVEGIFDP